MTVWHSGTPASPEHWQITEQYANRFSLEPSQYFIQGDKPSTSIYWWLYMDGKAKGVYTHASCAKAVMLNLITAEMDERVDGSRADMIIEVVFGKAVHNLQDALKTLPKETTRASKEKRQ